MKILYILLLLLAFQASTHGQSLDMYNIDASQFPVVKAKFRALDQDGMPLQSLSSTDFTITENGIKRTITKISCPPMQPPPALSSVLTMDISGSMNYGQDGVSNLDLAKTAARAWIEGLPGGKSESAITAFSDQNYFIQDFSNNKQKLLTALERLSPNGGTDYDKGLLLPLAGGLEVIKQAKYKRVLIFLSDGLPNFPPDEDAIVAMANQLEVTIFCVTLGLSMPESLKNVTRRTGGEWYENVTTQNQAEETYRKIMQAALGIPPCDIEWISNTDCNTERVITLELSSYNLRSNNKYSAPQSSKILINVNPSNAISMKEVPIGSYKDTTISISVLNSDIQITKITSSHPSVSIISYGGSAPPFLLKNGEKRFLQVRFTPLDSSRIFARLQIENNSCEPAYAYISGGFRNYKPSEQSLKITHPNGSEIFASGSDTVITWEGIPALDPVKLDFSSDKGGNWQNIVEKATGLQYEWHVPNTVSNQCLVKVSSYLDSTEKHDWAETGSTDNEDTTTNYFNFGETNAIATDEAGNCYIFGNFNRKMNFGYGNILEGSGFFIAKYTSDGSIIWAKKIAVQAEFSAVSIRVHNQEVFITGHTNAPSVNFDNGVVLVSSQYEGTYSFMAKYNDQGNILWAKSLGTGTKIRSAAIDGWGALYIGGTFDAPVISVGNNITLLKSGSSDGFLIKYSANGDPIWGKSIGGTGGEEVLSVATDIYSDDVVISGFFQTAILKLENGTELKSSGKENQYDENSFIIKYNSQGEIIWGKKAWESSWPPLTGREPGDRAFKVITDKSGEIYVGGIIRHKVSVQLSKDITLTNSGFYDATIVAKYDQQGNVMWAKFLPYFIDMSIDKGGNLFTGGGVGALPVDFGNGIVLDEMFGSFVAKYTTTGEVLWVKKISDPQVQGVPQIHLNALTCDAAGNILFGGYHSGTSIDFDNGIVKSGLSKFSVFTAKYSVGANTDQVDISDAVFSIIKPTAISQNIDMGRVFVASAKDSLIQSFITNTGSYPIRVDAINIAGAHARDFQLVSGIPPFTIPVGGKKSVEFRFRPSAVGARVADLEVVTQSDILQQSIIGEGVVPVIQVASSLVDFGIMEISSVKDTTVTAVLKNIGDVPLTIISTYMLGPDKEQFEIISGGGSFSLATGETQTMQLRFAPKYIGRTSGQIGFNYDGMPDGRPVIVQLFGQGLGGMAYVVDDSAYIGETHDIKLMLSKVKTASVAQTTASSFRATLAFKNSILTPAKAVLLKDATFKKGVDTDTLTITRQWSAQASELARIPFVATLGDRISTDIELLEFSWLDGKGQIVNYDTELQSGVFTVLGICPEGGERLFDIHGKELMMMVAPNPVKEFSEVIFSTIEKGLTTITLTDVLGRQVEITNQEYNVGEHSLSLPTKELPSGLYILTMKTPTQVLTQQVVIEK